MPRFCFIRRTGSVLAGLAFIVALSTACSGDATASDKPTPGATPVTSVASVELPKTDLHVDLNEWTVTPSLTRLAAGTLRISATNTGARPHDLVIIRVEDPKAGLPVKDDVVDETRVAIVDRFREFKSGEKEKSITLTPGEYLLICNIAGHYELGMAAAVSVR